MADLAVSAQQVNFTADAFLTLVHQQLASFKGIRVERTTPSQVTVYHRYTPGWAVLFGIIGLLVFLLGALLWFIKRTDTLAVSAIDAKDNTCVVTVSGASRGDVVRALRYVLSPQLEADVAALNAAATGTATT